MRRKDREITDWEKTDEIIRLCDCCRLGFNDGDEVYIVPLNFGFESKNGVRTFFFHSAKKGRKIRLISENGKACFQLDTGYELIKADTACAYSAKFKSVYGSGKISFIEEPSEKKHALLSIMRQTTGQSDVCYTFDALDSVCVFKLEVEELSCKVNN